MIRSLLIGVALLALATPAHAKKVKKSILPPPQFDPPFEGTIKVTRDSEASLPCRPRSLSTRLGCTYPPKKPDEGCVIYLALPDEIKEAGYSENDLWRHEIAFCNGWKGYRSLGDDSLAIEMDKEIEKEMKKKEKEEKKSPPTK
jgi:hypothetical protein